MYLYDLYLFPLFHHALLGKKEINFNYWNHLHASKQI